MAIIHANDNNFIDLTSTDTVLVDFYADWCGPCKMLSPILEDLANDRSEIKIVKVNVDEAHDTAKKFGVMSIPTIVLLKNGQLVDKRIGLCSKDTLVEMINQ